jgi:hypothetical protein
MSDTNPTEQNDRIDNAIAVLTQGWRSWAFDQLDGTSFISEELKSIDDAVDEAREAIQRLIYEARIDELRRIPWKSVKRYSIEKPYLTKEYWKRRLSKLQSSLNDKQEGEKQH